MRLKKRSKQVDADPCGAWDRAHSLFIVRQAGGGTFRRLPEGHGVATMRNRLEQHLSKEDGLPA